MKSSSFLRYIIQPASRKATWQEYVAFLIYSASLVIFCYLIFMMLSSPLYFPKLGSLQLQKDIDALGSLPKLQPLDVYQQVLDGHPIFGSLKQEVPAASKNPCDDFIQNFSLSGIVQGGNNEAIFLNKRTRQTYFLSAGDDLENISIRTISEHSVIVVCAGKEKEILIEET